jgi:threonine dehydrogenase-like Zn-dependent dehydrogenase
MSDGRIDCLIVGGGPAGLTAAIYLSRFRLSVVVVDAGDSRAALIPLTRNHAGFPDGISGQALLARMREQAELYGARMISARVEALEIAPEDFLVRCSTGAFRARAVLLATGVTDERQIVELLDPEGCRSLLFVQPHNGVFGAATATSSALTAQGTTHWSPTPGAELSVGLLKAMIAKRFKSVEAVSTCGLASKSRQDLNKKISMVDLHHDSIECYRRYYLQER